MNIFLERLNNGLIMFQYISLRQESFVNIRCFKFEL